MSKIILKPMTSLEKCFLDENLSAHKKTDRFVMFHNERLSFQIGIYNPAEKPDGCRRTSFSLEGEIAQYVTVREVMTVPVQYPTSFVGNAATILREKPSLY
ncbi:MAG: hypothetical protein MJ177_09090, partial [Clostridia bacterium]|nr:hypothetical protein [Clostridia bacterium]